MGNRLTYEVAICDHSLLTHAMERQLLNAFLAVAAVSADSGLFVINRFTLSCNAPGSFTASPSLINSPF